MPNIAVDHVLQPGQSARPLIWVEAPRAVARFPACDDEIMDKAMGSRAKAFRTWGHDERGVHWLCTQRGVQLHTDPAYTRYTHHLVIRNDGWMLVGTDGSHRHVYLEPGAMLCLDTHSPHALVLDPRRPTPEPRLKLALIVDATRPLTPDEAWSFMAPRLADPDCLAGAGDWVGRSKKVKPVA